MNILIIFPTGNALNNRAGAETRIWALVSSLVDLNYDVSVLHSINSIGNEDTQLKKKVTVYYYKNLTIHGISDWYLTDFNPFFFLKLAQILRKQKFDIIQLEFPWGFYTLKFLSHRKQCLIYNSHGIENEFMKIATKNPKFPKFLKPFARIYAKIYEKFVCKIANIVI
ncbi:MAG: glycosyltransferase family 4 protein, partial [Promethearchaeota archaeon]